MTTHTVKEIADDLSITDRQLLADACQHRALIGSTEKLKWHRLIYVDRVGIMSDLTQYTVTRLGHQVAAELKSRKITPPSFKSRFTDDAYVRSTAA